MKRLSFLAAPMAVAALLAGCAAPTAEDAGLRPQLAADTPLAAEPPHSPDGLFLAAAVALDAGSGESAAEMFARASLAEPGDQGLKERAFAANIIAGRIDRATQFAPQPGEAGDAVVALGKLATAVNAMAENRGKEAETILSGSGLLVQPHATAAALLQPWAAAMANDGRKAAPPHPGSDRVVLAFADLGRARLAERQGRFTVAEPLFKAISASRDSLFTQAYGGFLERRGRRADAVKLYDAALARTPDDPELLRDRTRAVAGKSTPPQPTLREGAAEALIGPAASLSQRREGDRGLSYMRLALRLDPDAAPIWMLVGEALESSGDLDSAAEAYGHVFPGKTEHPSALTHLALLREKADDHAGALSLAKAAYDEAPTDPQAMVTYAELLRTAKRFNDAIPVLTKLLDKTGKGKLAAKVYFLRAACYERAGRWPEAEADLKASLAIDPNDAEVQNYLGYAWADRGQHLKEAVALLQRAVAASPGQGALLDSLGWARLRSGDVRLALIDLERAAGLEPADPDIIEHLGDAYWSAGRPTDARYQWSRVLTLDPDDAQKAKVQQKLKDGGPTIARSTPAVAASPAPATR